MRVPSFSRYRSSMQAIAFLICGTIVGAAIYSTLYMDQSNRIMEQNYELKEQIVQLEEQIAKPSKGGARITGIVLFLTTRDSKDALDSVAETELKRRLREDLKSFIGRKIYEIGSDAQLARSLLEGRVYTDIEKRDYTVSIRTLLAADGRLTVWAEASPLLRK